MYKQYGIDRVLEPSHVLPTPAWKLDNDINVRPNEVKIRIKRIQLEETSFRQICVEANYDEKRIKRTILDIIKKRGKLHNPITDTGGVFYGSIAEIGLSYKNEKQLRESEEVICNASCASIPISLYEITNIDYIYGAIDVKGYAMASDLIPIVRKPTDLPIDILLFAFNQSATLYQISTKAVGKKNFLVVGNNLILNLLFGYSIRLVAGKHAKITCLLDKKRKLSISGKKVDELMSKVFTNVYHSNILKPLECMEFLDAKNLFDMSVNCADIPGAETINILGTKPHGTVIFTKLINNYNIALYITESISRHLDINCAYGYLESYDKFNIDIVAGMAPYLMSAHMSLVVADDDSAYPVSRESRLFEVSGEKKAMLDSFVCESHAMSKVLNEMLSVAKYDCNVLITGDHSVGKEKVASTIAKNSLRKMHPYIKFNCASTHLDLIEGDLFGYDKSMLDENYHSRTTGYFDMAENGVLFLNEITKLPTNIQVKLFQVIQDGYFFRVGGSTPINCNVRIISSTSHTIDFLASSPDFFANLYHALSVSHIHIPNLSERKGDIPPLIAHFTKIYTKKFSIVRYLEQDAIDYITELNLKGNIRELEVLIQRLLTSSHEENITLLDVMRLVHSDMVDSSITYNNISPVNPSNPDSEFDESIDLDKMVQMFEKNIIRRAYEKYGSTRKASAAIGISQSQLMRKKQKYNI